MRRLLVKYSKKGDARFLSHRETMRAMERALRRSGVPMMFTSGFNPHPKLSYAPALPLGVAAEGEYLEVFLEGNVLPEEAAESINRGLPEGLRVVSAQLLPPTMPRLSRWARYGLYRLSDGATLHLAIPLSGEGEGRLKDALERIGEKLGVEVSGMEVTRVGIYASLDEVLEDTPGTVYFYHGKSGELEEMEGQHAG